MLSIFTSAKNFKASPVIGNRTLNRWGLHAARYRLAGYTAAVYRAIAGLRLDRARREAFDRQGFVALHPFLDEKEFAALCIELCSGEWPFVEMAQPPAETQRVNLDARTCGDRFPALGRIIRNPEILRLLRYAAGCPGAPITALQIVRVDDPETGDDPQSSWHRDTFHPVSKAWLFLHDVAADAGPMAYVPGSHRATPKRSRWEYEMSLDAAADPDAMHSSGSLRADEGALRNLGYGDPFVAAVPANTLVVADTSGFHRRTPSAAPSVRLEIYFSLRRNPFFAALYPSILAIPFVRSRWAGWAYRYFEYRLASRRPSWIPRGWRALRPDESSRLSAPPR